MKSSERISSTELPEARREATWIGGKGAAGLQEAQRMWQEEMNTRTGQGKDPWVIEGTLDGKDVFRTHSIGGSVPEDFDNRSADRAEEVNYTVVAYRI